MRFFVPMLFVAALLSGCLAGDGTMSARDGLSEARSTANGMIDAPILISIESVEPFSHYEDESEEIWIYLDDTPGDGKAPGWVYSFASNATGEIASVVVASGLGVLAKSIYTPDDDEGLALAAFGAELAGWTVDSDEAARLLSKTDDWPDRTEDTFVFWGLYGDEEMGPVWFVEWTGPNGTHEAAISATNGTVLVTGAYGDDEGRVLAHGTAFDSGLTGPTGGPSVELDVGDGATLSYEASASASVNDMTIRLQGPGIDERTTMGNVGDLSSWLARGNADDLPAGTYTLTVETSTGVGMVDLFLEAEWMS